MNNYKEILLKSLEKTKISLTKDQYSFNSQMKELFQESGELLVNIISLQDSIKFNKESEKKLNEELEKIAFQDTINGENSEFIVKEKKSTKLDLKKLKKLESKGEIVIPYVEPKIDEKKLKSLYKNLDIFQNSSEFIFYSPKLEEIKKNFAFEETKEDKKNKTTFSKMSKMFDDKKNEELSYDFLNDYDSEQSI